MKLLYFPHTKKLKGTSKTLVMFDIILQVYGINNTEGLYPSLGVTSEIELLLGNGPRTRRCKAIRIDKEEEGGI